MLRAGQHRLRLRRRTFLFSRAGKGLLEVGFAHEVLIHAAGGLAPFGDAATIGDAYTFVGIERNRKLVLAWHLGRRTTRDTEAFAEKLNEPTARNFQITTDGFAAYRDAVSLSLGTRVDFAQLINLYASSQEEPRYSPAEVVSTEVVRVIGRPDPNKICTSHVERQNLTMRMQIRRFTRLTNAFSKKWENHYAALTVYFAYYSFVRIHQTLRVTPAMESGLTDHVWTLRELLGNNSA